MITAVEFLINQQKIQSEGAYRKNLPEPEPDLDNCLQFLFHTMLIFYFPVKVKQKQKPAKALDIVFI